MSFFVKSVLMMLMSVSIWTTNAMPDGGNNGIGCLDGYCWSVCNNLVQSGAWCYITDGSWGVLSKARRCKTFRDCIDKKMSCSTTCTDSTVYIDKLDF